MTLRKRIRAIWEKWWPRQIQYSAVEHVMSMSEVPEHTKKLIYVVGSIPKWVVFECPCHRNHRISIPLMKNVTPHWAIAHDGQTISLFPSVSVSGSNCDSHFWLRQNRIEWAHG
jgi:hypothetical protein